MKEKQLYNKNERRNIRSYLRNFDIDEYEDDVRPAPVSKVKIKKSVPDTDKDEESDE